MPYPEPTTITDFMLSKAGVIEHHVLDTNAGKQQSKAATDV